MGRQCFEPGQNGRSLLEMTDAVMCHGGDGCTLDHGGDVPKLRDGGPVSDVAFNPALKPAWSLASRVAPEALLPVTAGVTMLDGMLDG